MEEQNKSKEVKMKVASVNKKSKDSKYTYEQLADICNKLFQENQYLKKQSQQMTETLASINRLDYLFKVLEVYYSNKQNNMTFNDSFVSKCLDEIEAVIFASEQKEEEKEG